MYYYRPRPRTSTRPRPSDDMSRDDLRQEKAHRPTTEAPHTHESLGGTQAQGPAGPQAQQTVAMLDTETLLYLLALLDRLSRAEEEARASSSAPIETGEDLMIESTPPPASPEEEDTQDMADPPAPRSWRTRRLAVLLLALCVLTALAVMAVSLLPLVTASATVTIIPVQRAITASTQLAIVTTGTANPAHQQVPGRHLSALTLSQQETVPTTGRGFQQARQAQGILTFYNALPQAQSIPAGTLLTSLSGIQIVTDQDVVIPAGTGAVNGQASVSAHAVQSGPQGNIAAGTITGTCCRSYVLVANRSAFAGGQDARIFPMVAREDISGAATSLKTSLIQSVQAAFQAQVRPDETLITPPACTPKVTASHAAGDEASQVSVTVEESCTGETYATQALHAQVLQIVTQQADAHLGTGYTLAGDIQVSITHVGYTDQKQGSALTLQVTGTGTWASQFDDVRLQHLTHLIAGKSRQQATQLLLQVPGVSQVSMSVSGAGGTTSLPADAGRIHVLVLYQAV